jgi:hypothetical protein
VGAPAGIATGEGRFTADTAGAPHAALVRPEIDSRVRADAGAVAATVGQASGLPRLAADVLDIADTCNRVASLCVLSRPHPVAFTRAIRSDMPTPRGASVRSRTDSPAKTGKRPRPADSAGGP